jgi:regulator of replication initiation timing
MTLKFKHSFIGYDPNAVADKIEAINQEFTTKFSELRQELAAHVHQTELLKIEVERLKLDLADKVALQNDIMQRLVTAHLSAAERVIDVLKVAEQKELEVANLIGVRKCEWNELWDSSRKMRGEVTALVTRYGTKFGWREENEPNA